MEPKADNNSICSKFDYYSSPLRDKIFLRKEIWPLEKILEKFIELRENRLAYETIKNNNKNNNDNNDNNDNSQEIKKENSKKKMTKAEFDKLYESFMEKENIREKTLQKRKLML